MVRRVAVMSRPMRPALEQSNSKGGYWGASYGKFCDCEAAWADLKNGNWLWCHTLIFIFMYVFFLLSFHVLA
jgi:hypothetical protein